MPLLMVADGCNRGAVNHEPSIPTSGFRTKLLLLLLLWFLLKWIPLHMVRVACVCVCVIRSDGGHLHGGNGGEK